MYLGMALFWLIVGILIQVFWADLQPRMNFQIDRTMMGLLCFVLFSYSFVRWRMAQMRERSRQAEEPPRRRHPEQPIDPTFDFSDDKDGKR